MGNPTPPHLPPPPDERLHRLDKWLKELHDERPFCFNLIVLAVSLFIFSPVLLVLWWTNR